MGRVLVFDTSSGKADSAAPARLSVHPHRIKKAALSDSLFYVVEIFLPNPNLIPR